MADSVFREVIDIRGGTVFSDAQPLSMSAATKSLVEYVFGKPQQQNDDWNVHIIDLSALTSDLMPFVVAPLLETFADELFSRGPGKTHPTLLVLEEAHHYLRQRAVEDSSLSSLAYERLAKEGRKFNLSVMVSTQRPSELSPSVLSQCGTWCVMRLTNESDLRTLQSATDSSEKISFSRVSSLMRGYAYVFGGSIRVPQIIKTKLASPQPDSQDAAFSAAWTEN
jgi:DNA helicase HerA-like ATPase